MLCYSIILLCCTFFFGEGLAGVVGKETKHSSILARDDVEDACFPACGPTTCGTSTCASLTSRSIIDTLAYDRLNDSDASRMDGSVLEKRRFQDTIYDLKTDTYVADQARRIRLENSIKPGMGASRPSHCLLRQFASFQGTEQQIFGTPDTERMRGCVVFTIVSARAFYMCHLYETYHFSDIKDNSFVGLKPVLDHIKGTGPSVAQISGDRFDRSLFSDVSDGTVLYSMVPRRSGKRKDKDESKYDAEITNVENAFRDLLPHVKAVRFPYRAITGVTELQPWQGLAVLEWDPDFNGLGVGVGTSQWRLWYEYAHITGLVNDGLKRCLSTDDGGPYREDTVPALESALVGLQLVTKEQQESDAAGDSDVAEGVGRRGLLQDTSMIHVNASIVEKILHKRGKKQLKWDFPKDMQFGTYPAPNEVKKHVKYDVVDRFWGFEAFTDPANSCPTRIRHIPFQLTNDLQYDTEHILEAQVLKAFFDFVCQASTVVPLPAGYRAAQRAWVTTTLLGLPSGSSGGFAFQTYRTLLAGVATALGNRQGDGPKRLVLIESNINGAKAKWFEGGRPDPGHFNKELGLTALRALKLRHRSAVGAIQFMQQPSIWTKFQESTKLVEMTLRSFDESYPWGRDGQQELQRPRRTPGQPQAGLRDLWCWFIDKWLENLDSRIRAWPADAVTAIRSLPNAHAHDQLDESMVEEATDWIDKFLSGPNSPAQQMRLPKPFAQHASHTPGQVKTGSVYGAWNMANDAAWYAGPW